MGLRSIKQHDAKEQETSINIKHRTNIHWQRHTERTVLLKNLKS